MSLFDALGGSPAASRPMNPMQMLSELKANPAHMLSKAGFKVPENISSNPQAIVQHLLNTNQITPQRLANAQSQVGRSSGRR